MAEMKVKGLKLSFTNKENVVIQNDKVIMKEYMLGLGVGESIAEDAANTFSHPKLTLVNLDIKRIRMACVDDSRLFGISREKVSPQGDYYVRSNENGVANCPNTSHSYQS